MNEGVMIQSFEDAIIMVASVRAALRNGVKHFDREGYALFDEKEIIACLREEGAVLLDASERVEMVTVEEMIEQVRKDYGWVVQ